MIADPQIVHYGVGLDTARYGHHVSLLDSQKRTAAKAFHFTENAEGYQLLHKVLQSLAKKHALVHFHVRVDAAGQYAENLLQFLHRLPFKCTISVGQPARNAAYRVAVSDKRKADPVESLACARFAIVERPAATPHNPVEFSQLRDAVAMMESSAKQRTRLVNQLHGLLARIFPELAVHASDIAANWVLTLLEKYPTAAKVAGAKLESLVKIPHLDSDVAKALHEAAKVSTASNTGSTAEQMIRAKVREIRAEQASFDELARLTRSAFEALPDGPHKRILTIKGIGIQTAAALVAKIVSIDRFETPTALVGYFGVFPEEVDTSGTDRQGNPKAAKERHMSRKGNDLVRRLLYTAAQSAATWNPPVRALFARQMASGKCYNVAIGHCMTKLLRQVFALWKTDCDFDPEYEAKRLNQPQASETTPAAASTPIQVAAVQSQLEPTPVAMQPEKAVVGHRKAVEPQRSVVTTTSHSITEITTAQKRPPLDFAKLRAMISMDDILQQLDWHPQTKRGSQQRGRCPVHQRPTDTDRCFAVNTTKNAYCCHDCKSQGNALDLWAAARQRPLLDAGWELIELLNLPAPILNAKPVESGQQSRSQKKNRQAVAKATT